MLVPPKQKETSAPLILHRKVEEQQKDISEGGPKPVLFVMLHYSPWKLLFQKPPNGNTLSSTLSRTILLLGLKKCLEFPLNVVIFPNRCL